MLRLVIKHKNQKLPLEAFAKIIFSSAFRRDVIRRLTINIMTNVVNTSPQGIAEEDAIDQGMLEEVIAGNSLNTFNTPYLPYPDGLTDEYNLVVDNIQGSVKGNTSTISLPRDINYLREYYLSIRGNQGMIMYGNPDVHEWDIAEEIVNGYWMLQNPKDGSRGGPATFVKGRDILMTATYKAMKGLKNIIIEEIFKYGR